MDKAKSEFYEIENIEEKLFDCYMTLADLEEKNKKRSQEYKNNLIKLDVLLDAEKMIIDKYSKSSINNLIICQMINNILNMGRDNDDFDGIYTLSSEIILKKIFDLLTPLCDYYYEDEKKIGNQNITSDEKSNEDSDEDSEDDDEEDYEDDCRMKQEEILDNIELESYYYMQLYEQLIGRLMNLPRNELRDIKYKVKYGCMFIDKKLMNTYREHNFDNINFNVLKYNMDIDTSCLAEDVFMDSFDAILEKIDSNSSEEYKNTKYINEILFIYLKTILDNGNEYLEKCIEYPYPYNHESELNNTENRKRVFSLLKKYKKE